MDAGEANRAACFGFGGILDFFGKKKGIKGDLPAGAEGIIVLTDLIILGHIGVEIVFAIKPCHGGEGATEH